MYETLCMGCMRDKGNAPVCPHCGFREDMPHGAAYLPLRTLIAQRYLVGRVLSANGESVSYIGFDTMSQKRVDIREYFPDTLAGRGPDGVSVRVMEGRQIPYKANMGDYTDMMRKLTRMRTLACVVQVLALAEENNTVYAVLEHVDAVSLREYLVRKGTMLSWQEASELLMPAVKTLRLLHQDGILHRGLSVDTLYVTPYDTVKIGGFSISAVRAARTELAAELFPGYSAPEQYSAVSPHGPWTDVYAMCAVLYTALTGQRPPEALVRSPEKQLMPPRERNETVPPYISEAILKGLSVDSQKRMQDMDALAASLTGIPTAQEQEPAAAEPEKPAHPTVRRPVYQGREEATAYYHPAPHKPQAETHSAEPEQDPGEAVNPEEGKQAERRRTRRLVMNSMLIALPILFLALLLTFWMLFGGRGSQTRQEEDSSDTTASDEWLVSSYPRDESGSSSQASAPVSSGTSSEESRQSSAESSEESQAEVYVMDNFLGKKYADVIADAKNRELYIFEEPEYLYSSDQPEGYIISQDVTPGIEISAGTRVKLTVSLGSSVVTLPPYEKVLESTYTAQLDSLNVKYKVVYKTGTNYPAGYVVGTSSPDGTVDISTSSVLEVYVSADE